MTVQATTSTSVSLPAGDVWPIAVLVTQDGVPVESAPVITVTLPNGTTSTPTVEADGSGGYHADVTVTAGGRYVAEATAPAYGVAVFTAFVSAVTLGADMPDVAAVKKYLTDEVADQWADDVLQEALDTEAAAQRARCKVPAAYPADLREGLLRRVQVNLDRRGKPAAVPLGDGGIGPAFLPGNDPEVRRLEGPHRKRKVG